MLFDDGDVEDMPSKPERKTNVLKADVKRSLSYTAHGPSSRSSALHTVKDKRAIAFEMARPPLPRPDAGDYAAQKLREACDREE